MKVTVLSGGVGGARFLRGVLAVVEPDNVSIIGNVGDDVEVLGLHVSPDLDSILYALAGRGRRGARLGSRRRDLERARDGRPSSAGTPGSGSATAISASISSARSCSAPALPLSEATARLAARLRAPLRAPAGDRRPAADVPRDAGRDVPVPDLVRRPRPPRRGRRSALRGQPRCAARAGRARGDRRGGRDRDRAEQSVRLDRADPRRGGDPARRRRPPGSVRGRQPAHRRPGGQGARRPDARPPRGRHHARGDRRLLRGADRRARDRRGRRASGAPGGRAPRRDARR